MRVLGVGVGLGDDSGGRWGGRPTGVFAGWGYDGGGVGTGMNVDEIGCPVEVGLGSTLSFCAGVESDSLSLVGTITTTFGFGV